MATSTLRAIILVAAVALGLLGLSKAFPGDASRALTPPSGSTNGSESPSPSPSASRTRSSSPSAPGKIQGVVVQVLNGSGVIGQASQTSAALSAAGYDVKVPGDAPHTAVTTIFYRGSSGRADAQLMKSRFFPSAAVKPATATTSSASDVELTLVLGADFTPLPTASASASATA